MKKIRRQLREGKMADQNKAYRLQSIRESLHTTHVCQGTDDHSEDDADDDGNASQPTVRDVVNVKGVRPEIEETKGK